MLLAFCWGFACPGHAQSAMADGESPVAISVTQDSATIRIRGSAHRERIVNGPKPFTRIEGTEVGLLAIDTMSTADFRPPFFNGRGIAAGDFDRDGFSDLLFGGSDGGLELYRNIEGERFERVPIEIPQIVRLEVFSVALVDLDDDEWLDIYLTSYADGSHYIISDRGVFKEEHLHAVNGTPTSLSHAVSFGDIDRDGDLDAAVGNWFYGLGRFEPASEAINALHFYEDGKFEVRPAPGITGESLSILLSDFSGDRVLDTIVGNDFTPPDVFLLGDGSGRFTELTAQDGLIPTGTQTTMSVDTADINNDLLLDIYLTQIAASATGRSARVPKRSLDEYCVEIENAAARASCELGISYRMIFNWGPKRSARDLRHCGKIEDPSEQRMCKGMMIMMMAPKVRKPTVCERIPKDLERPRHFCKLYFRPPVETSEEMWQRSIPQVQNENVLLVASAGEPFTDRAREFGVNITNWSWNSKIMDLDNDGWQDIYVVNGTWERKSSPQKFFFHNKLGESFEDRTAEFGLDTFMIVSAYVNVDLDNDGDLDLVTNSINGPTWLYRNNEKDNHAVSFDVRDLLGNRYGIGTQLILHYGEGEAQHQIREIKAGGGYLSFDEAVAHFGLGAVDHFSRLEIYWSTGEHTELRGNFPADTRYRIERSPTPGAPSE